MITIQWSNIKRDVDKQTYRLAKVHISDDSVEVRDKMQEDDSAASLRFIYRFAVEGMALVRHALRDKVTDASGLSDTDDIATDNATWTMDVGDADNGVASTLIHKAVVDYILWRWCSRWLPNLSGTYKAMYDESIAEVRSCVYTLAWPVKTKRELYKETDNNVTITYE